jgi:hypothetical protein
MAKRKAESQTTNLIPNHKKSRIDLISVCAGDMQYAIGKLSTRAATLL